jgi:secondary thiamine-phosphate synthase enzyme
MPRPVTFRVTTRSRCEMIDITDRIEAAMNSAAVENGLAVVCVPHTTAGVTVQENADPDVQHDILLKLDRLFPRDEPGFRHAEGNSDSHLKTMFVGSSVTLMVQRARLVRGTWQGVYLCEFDGPRERNVTVQVVGDPQRD